MEPRKRNRGTKLREIMDRITPQEEARVFKQMAIAARIADALQAVGWSKSEFAARMNQQPSIVTRWLSGTHNFTLDTLSDIEEGLGIKLLETGMRLPTVEFVPEQTVYQWSFSVRQTELVGDGSINSETVDTHYGTTGVVFASSLN